jgi:hypothetical protein
MALGRPDIFRTGRQRVVAVATPVPLRDRPGHRVSSLVDARRAPSRLVFSCAPSPTPRELPPTSREQVRASLRRAHGPPWRIGRVITSSWAMMFSCFSSRSMLLAAVTIAGSFPASGRCSAPRRLSLASASSVALGGHGWAVQPAVADTEVAPSMQVSGCGSEPLFRQDRRCGLPRGSSTDDV